MQPVSRPTLAALIALSLVALPHADAQETGANASPTEPAQNASPFGAFDVGAIYGQLIDSILTQLAKPEMAAKLARFQRQHFDALVKEGFNPEEALKIVTSTQVPLQALPSSRGGPELTLGI